MYWYWFSQNISEQLHEIDFNFASKKLSKGLSILPWAFDQDAFHVKHTPKVRQALSFHTPGTFKEREAAKKSDDLKKLSTDPISLFLMRKGMLVLSKETAERLRTTSHSPQSRYASFQMPSQNRLYWRKLRCYADKKVRSMLKIFEPKCMACTLGFWANLFESLQAGSGTAEILTTRYFKGNFFKHMQRVEDEVYVYYWHSTPSLTLN